MLTGLISNANWYLKFCCHKVRQSLFDSITIVHSMLSLAFLLSFYLHDSLGHYSRTLSWLSSGACKKSPYLPLIPRRVSSGSKICAALRCARSPCSLVRTLEVAVLARASEPSTRHRSRIGEHMVVGGGAWTTTATVTVKSFVVGVENARVPDQTSCKDYPPVYPGPFLPILHQTHHSWRALTDHERMSLLRRTVLSRVLHILTA